MKALMQALRDLWTTLFHDPDWEAALNMLAAVDARVPDRVWADRVAAQFMGEV